MPDLFCGGCTLCCQGDTIVVHPGEPHKQWKTDFDHRTGQRTLRKGLDGNCVYLKPTGCSIHGKQPHECRAYDCRKHSIIVDRMPAHERAWREADPERAVVLAHGRRKLAEGKG